jgi:hypothetical protein
MGSYSIEIFYGARFLFLIILFIYLGKQQQTNNKKKPEKSKYFHVFA